MPDNEYSEYGLTLNGFNPKRLYDIREELKKRLENITDPDSGERLQVDWNEDDPLIQILNAFCDELSALWQIAYQVYSQFNPLLATGDSLSGLVQLNGIVRKVGSPSTVELTFTGQSGVLIPKGTIAFDVDKKMKWETISDLVIGENGYVTGVANSTEDGSWIFPAGSINEMEIQINGVASVINENASVGGIPDESDSALRLRRIKSTETPSRGIAESIYGAVSNLEGVSYVKVYCNRTLETDELGIPPKSVAVVVQGGVTTEIAKEIFYRASIGCAFYGSTTVNFIDSMGVATGVSFSRPTNIPIKVQMTIGEVEGSDLPDDYASLIKENILRYAAGGPSAIGVSGGFDDFGFPVGEDIVATRLYLPVSAVKGVKIVSLEIAKNNGAFSTNDIAIAWNEVGIFDADDITITLQN